MIKQFFYKLFKINKHNCIFCNNKLHYNCGISWDWETHTYYYRYNCFYCKCNYEFEHDIYDKRIDIFFKDYHIVKHKNKLHIVFYNGKCSFYYDFKRFNFKDIEKLKNKINILQTFK